MELRASIATFVVFFLLGYYSVPDDLVTTETPAVHQAGNQSIQGLHHMGSQDVLQRQRTAHVLFQQKIQEIQSLHPSECGESRKLVLKKTFPAVGPNPHEQFARAFQFLGLSLQVAVATRRSLVVEDPWTLLPGIQGNCESWDMATEPIGRSISCLRQAVTYNCNSQSKKTIATSILDQATTAFGIIPGVPITEQNSLFHADYYGPQVVMEMPSWPYPKDTYMIDVVPTYERLFGRFWVRSQLVHYIWEKWRPSAPASATSDTLPYIAFYWSSCKKMRKNLAVKYGRNATYTQDFGRYMALATDLRKTSPTLRTIHIVTDDANGAPIPDQSSLKRQYPDWSFWTVPSSNRPTETSTTTRDGEILGPSQQKRMLTGLQVLRKADYLVGSFQTQMFRLAAELNAAWFCTRYPVSIQRHWTVDVEWFENP